MSTEIQTQPDPVTKAARDLSEIEDLSATLGDQAEHKASDQLMPGGLAMVSLVGVANLEAWEHIFEAGEASASDISHIFDEDDDWEPPLQTLCFWSEQLRRDHGHEYDQRPTISSEAGYLRHMLNWLWENEPQWDDFAKDINRARTRLENVLYAGRRAERVRVKCIDVNCETKPRLIKVYGEQAVDDRYKCPRCKRRYDDGDYARAKADLLDSEGAERFVRIQDAVRSLDRPERTVRKWFEDCKISGYCDRVTHQVWVWWPDLRKLDLDTPRRQRRIA